MFALGIVLEVALIRPLKRDRTLLSILVTFAIALIIEGILGKVFTTDYVQLDAWYVTQSFQLPLVHRMDPFADVSLIQQGPRSGRH